MLRIVAATMLAASALVVLLTGPLATGSAAQDNDDSEADPTDAGFVEVLEVSALLDDVVAASIEDAILVATADNARGLVLIINSKQSLLSDAELNELALQIVDSPIPVSVWVGPSGARALGEVAQLVAVADSVGVAIGAKLGATGEQVLDEDQFGVLWGDNHELMVSTDLTWVQAIEVGIVECDLVDIDELGNPLTPDQSLARCANPTVGDFLVGLDTFDSLVVDEGNGPRLQPLTAVRFRSLSLLDQLMHTVASPPVAYLMLVVGLLLIVFEFYSIGVGVAGAIGAVLLGFGGYGMTVLPTRTWALILLVGCMLAFSIDIQTAVPRAWTFIGMAMLVIGTVGLYPQADVSMSWIPMTVVIVGMAIAMFRGMPIMVRGRFATTVIPRDFLVDEAGVVVDSAANTLTVEIRGASWHATSDAHLVPGTDVRVTDVDELILCVESAS